jgi:hypothetical protein
MKEHEAVEDYPTEKGTDSFNAGDDLFLPVKTNLSPFVAAAKSGSGIGMLGST